MRRAIIGLPVLLAALGFVIPNGSDQESPHALEVIFFDVGQGDCALLMTHGTDPKVIVIDGGFVSTARSSVVPFLEQRGISKIDLMILSHPDKDHVSGLRELIRKFEVVEIWDPGFENETNMYNDFKALAQAEAGERYYRPFEDQEVDSVIEGLNDADERRIVFGEAEEFGDLRIIPLHSNRNLDGPNQAYRVNNSSIVVKVEFGANSILFTGDANGRKPTADPSKPDVEGPFYTEKALLDLDDQDPGILQSTVVKVPHHGSLTSSSEQFLDRVRPKWAIISSGFSTNHGLPRAETLTRYSNMHTNIIRTDVGDFSNLKGDDHLQLLVGEREDELIWRQIGTEALLDSTL